MKREQVSRLGGLKRVMLYGNPGTYEGRKLGGSRSLRTHAKNGGNFKVLRHIKLANKSPNLAEILGILIGDGHLSEYQVSVVTNIRTDYAHAMYFAKLMSKMFFLKPTLMERPRDGAVVVVFSSKMLADYFEKLGMPRGNKISSGLLPPKWIMRSSVFKRAFIRGLFDTDGSVYLDKHEFNGKIYLHLGWTITSAAVTLCSGIVKILKSLGFNPTWRASQRSVFMRRQAEIQRYFEEIGSSNPKHKERFLDFSGRVPKRS